MESDLCLRFLLLFRAHSSVLFFLSSSTAMETINYPALTNLHHYFYGQFCTEKELPCWKCPAGAARMWIQQEKLWNRAGETWPVEIDVAKGWEWATGKVSPWSGLVGKKNLFLLISSVIVGVWENMDTWKAWRDFCLGLMFAGLVSWLSQSWPRWERLSQVCCSPQNHFHTDMMEKWIISPPVHLQPLITWITVWVCCHTGLGSCDAA